MASGPEGYIFCRGSQRRVVFLCIFPVIFENQFDDGGCPPSTETASNRTGFTVDNVAVGSGSAERFMNVSGRGYRHVDGQCFAGDPFDRVRTVVADGNLLRLATFRTFRSVQRLSLRRNRMDSVEPYVSWKL